MSYSCQTFKATVSEPIAQPSYIVEKALVFEYDSAVLHCWADDQKPIIQHVISQFPDAEGEMYEVVFASKHAQFPFKCPTGILVPADVRLITELERQLRQEHAKGEPKGWVMKHKFDCITKPKPAPKAQPRISKADPGIKPIDIDIVPDDLRFMCTEGFKDQARQFYSDLGYVQPSSDRSWVRKRFVDGLGNWSHIARADEALGGLISQTMSIVAENPHFPSWWRSFGVYLMRGNPEGVIRACNDVISYNGNVNRVLGNGEVRDRHFGA